jgi:hypothetical protein
MRILNLGSLKKAFVGVSIQGRTALWESPYEISFAIDASTGASLSDFRYEESPEEGAFAGTPIDREFGAPNRLYLCNNPSGLSTL